MIDEVNLLKNWFYLLEYVNNCRNELLGGGLNEKSNKKYEKLKNAYKEINEKDIIDEIEKEKKEEKAKFLKEKVEKLQMKS